jgi:hypothetical protein
VIGILPSRQDAYRPPPAVRRGGFFLNYLVILAISPDFDTVFPAKRLTPLQAEPARASYSSRRPERVNDFETSGFRI